MDLSDEKLRQLLELEAKATPWEWKIEEETGIITSWKDDEFNREINVCRADAVGPKHFVCESKDDKKNNIQFIASSRNHFRPLVEELLRLRKEIRYGKDSKASGGSRRIL